MSPENPISSQSSASELDFGWPRHRAGRGRFHRRSAGRQVRQSQPGNPRPRLRSGCMICARSRPVARIARGFLFECDFGTQGFHRAQPEARRQRRALGLGCLDHHRRGGQRASLDHAGQFGSWQIRGGGGRVHQIALAFSISGIAETGEALRKFQQAFGPPVPRWLPRPRLRQRSRCAARRQVSLSRSPRVDRTAIDPQSAAQHAHQLADALAHDDVIDPRIPRNCPSMSSTKSSASKALSARISGGFDPHHHHAQPPPA